MTPSGVSAFNVAPVRDDIKRVTLVLAEFLNRLVGMCGMHQKRCLCSVNDLQSLRWKPGLASQLDEEQFHRAPEPGVRKAFDCDRE